MVAGIKSFERTSSVEKAISKYLPDLQNCVFLYGKTGSGKTTTSMALIQKYHDIKGYKVFDMWGGQRKENLFWCFPNQDTKYWKGIMREFSMKGEGPKQYNVNIWYPYYHKMTRKKLPWSDHVKGRMFTIPFEDINLEDISLVLGTLSERDKYLWNSCIQELGQRKEPIELLQLAEAKATKNQAIFRSFIQPLIMSMTLQSSKCHTNIDLETELKDRQTITVFCLDFIPEEYKLFVMGWIYRQIFELLNTKLRLRKNIILIRESAEFFKATDDSISPENYKIFRKVLSNRIRYGRIGAHAILDSQSIRETRGLISGSQDYTILCQMPGPEDREDATLRLKQDGLITAKQIRDLASLNPGHFLFCEAGKKTKSMYSFKPRTMYWEPGVGDFHKHLWPKYVGTWKDISDTIVDLQKIYNDAEAGINEVKKLAKLGDKKNDIEEKKIIEQDSAEDISVEVDDFDQEINDIINAPHEISPANMLESSNEVISTVNAAAVVTPVINSIQQIASPVVIQNTEIVKKTRSKRKKIKATEIKRINLQEEQAKALERLKLLYGNDANSVTTS